MSQIKYISVPFRSGCNREGAQFAPKELLRILKPDSKQVVNLDFSSEHFPLTDKAKNGVNNYESVLYMTQNLREVCARLLSQENRLFVIGGDHSIGLGSVAASLEYDSNVGVIWFDAHGDINTEQSSPSANAHGMPVAALMHLCNSELITMAPVKLNPQNIFWVGVRDLDEAEFEILKSQNVITNKKWKNTDVIEGNVYTVSEIHKRGMKAVMSEIVSKMAAQGIKNIHLSFDIDAMDPSIVQATGTKVNDGLLQNDLDEFISELYHFPDIRTIDFVEYNPFMDDSELTTADWCIETIKKLSILF